MRETRVDLTVTAPDEVLLFFWGADMQPSVILAAFPPARFVARAQVDRAALSGLALPLPHPGIGETVWGIVVRIPGTDQPPNFARLEVMTDAGQRLEAGAASRPGALATPSETLAAARYWELTPSYVHRLAELLVHDDGGTRTGRPK
jgi:hypothetical protein